MTPKTIQEIEIMREGGRLLGTILQELLSLASVGVSLIAIEERAVDRIEKAGGTPSFRTVPGYRWATCLCINEGVVHCIPTDYVLKDGDLLTIDIGMVYKGLHTDTAWTKIIGEQKTEDREQKERFLRTGEEALWKAIEQAKVGNRVGHISQAIQTTIEAAGYNIVTTLTGHGVGRELHEDPQIPGFVRGTIENSFLLIERETIAIEVIYAEGRGDIVSEHDGWTLTTRDRSLSAVFEHTIAVTQKSPIILTKGEQ